MESFHDQANGGKTEDFMPRIDSSPVIHQENNSNDSFKTTHGVYGGGYARKSLTIANQ
jgi:hypothetical protein